MSKTIVICSDGTWNKPEEDLEKDIPTNVLKLSRAIAPKNKNNEKQVVFYDWGIGTYHDKASGGAFGAGLEKNVMDCYRFIVQNYEKNDKIFLFGFSRGAYTVRSLCGLINTCHILKSEHGNQVNAAFDLYKNPKHSPNSAKAKKFRSSFAVAGKPKIDFIGAWDTVGAMGIPFTLFGLLKKKHVFYDNKMGSNIKVARHALALDEQRDDFAPTLWQPRPSVDLKQVWFCGSHSDIGGGNPPSKGSLQSDFALMWMVSEAEKFGLTVKPHIKVPKKSLNVTTKLNNSFKGLIVMLGKKVRDIPDPKEIPTFVHQSVLDRMAKSKYHAKPLKAFSANSEKPLPVEPY
ncbi:DUF2235 domain-containing protein [Reinekea marina]|uniref:DUF2235 domain-containing protein n=1 Tax=Reinekea marina TaxID=1310421 RepID=A0ABV7WW70_9GAMM|nr:DUF2235 domain-containing protein [Reinekea marina]MBU2862880.1 DUF2235 domain-containing protein [Reinekea forsetii]MDN3649138.1 DUF2235 domain-containing protein [Reinekea marina]